MKKTNSSLIVTFGSVLFLAVLFFGIASSYFHRKNVVTNSEYRYTIVTLTDYYSRGKVSGKVITYSLNGVQYEDHCGDRDCRDAKIGDRFFIKVYVSDPKIWEILYSKRINRIDSIPVDGWKVLPK